MLTCDTHTYTYIYIYNRKDPLLTLTGGAVHVRARQLLPAAGAGALRRREPSMGLPGAAQEASGLLLHGLSIRSPGLGAAAGMPGVSLRAAVCLSRLQFTCPQLTPNSEMMLHSERRR